MNIIFKTIVYVFIGLGFVLLAILLSGLLDDKAIHYHGYVDWKYLKKVADVSAFILILWNIVGVFLLYLTLNIQQKQFKATFLSIKQQQFETTFFNMLNVLTNIKQSIYYEYKEYVPHEQVIKKKSQEFLEFVLSEFKNSYNGHINSLNDNNPIKITNKKVQSNSAVNLTEVGIIRDDLDSIYLPIYKKYQTDLAHYFRYVYNLIKFAINNRQEYKDEKNYIDLIQAQLTNDELSLIFYNAYSSNGLNTDKVFKLHEWLDHYEFFENIDSTSLILREHHILYPKTKFKFLNSDEKKLKSNEIFS
jgi:hypothetical protein